MADAISPEQLLQFEQLNFNLTYGLNGLWLIITGAGILFMQVGFMALEVGIVKAKNVKAAIFKNLFDHAIGTLAWYLIGFSLFMGSTSPIAAGDDVVWLAHNPQYYSKIFQQYAFAVTACTIVSGAVISRCKFETYIIFSFFLSAYIYPIVAHWCWNDAGWLAQMGFQDFAGGAVVHLLGGAAAFVGAAACGPRVGRFSPLQDLARARGGSEAGGSEAGRSEALVNAILPVSKLRALWDLVRRPFKAKFRVRESPGHSAELQGLGALFLYVAWFSFNSGSGGMITDKFYVHIAGRAAVNTFMACASASITGLAWSHMFYDSYSMELGVNTLLAGLVAVTAPCGYIAPWAAFVIGVLSVPVYSVSSHLVLYQLAVDDPLHAVAVHACCGTLGTVWIGFADLNRGMFYTGNADLLGVQCLGCLAIAAWSAVNAIVFFYGIRTVAGPMFRRIKRNRRFTGVDLFNRDVHPNPLVYSEDVQLVGMDFANFGGSAYPDFDVEAVTEFNETKRIKERLVAKQARMNRFAAGNRPGSEDWRENSQHRFKDASEHKTRLNLVLPTATSPTHSGESKSNNPMFAE